MTPLCALLMMSLLVGSAHAMPVQDEKAVERGKAVFTEQKCSLCHSVAGKGNPKGSLDDVGSKLSGEQIRQWLLTPKEMAQKEKATRKPPMQPYTKLSKTDLDALVAFLQTLKK